MTSNVFLSLIHCRRFGPGTFLGWCIASKLAWVYGIVGRATMLK